MNRSVPTATACLLQLLIASLCSAAGAGSRPCVTGVYASPATITAGQKTVINATTNRAAFRVVVRFNDAGSSELSMIGRDHTWSVTTPIQTRAGHRFFTVTAFDSVGGSGGPKTGSLHVKPAPVTRPCASAGPKPAPPSPDLFVGPPEPAVPRSPSSPEE